MVVVVGVGGVVVVGVGVVVVVVGVAAVEVVVGAVVVVEAGGGRGCGGGGTDAVVVGSGLVVDVAAVVEVPGVVVVEADAGNGTGSPSLWPLAGPLPASPSILPASGRGSLTWTAPKTPRAMITAKAVPNTEAVTKRPGPRGRLGSTLQLLAMLSQVFV